MSVLQVGTHFAAFLLGVATWLPFALRAARRAARPPYEETMPVNATPPPVRRATLVGVVGIIVALALVGFGLQQARYQRQAEQDQARADAQQECTSVWGKELLETITTRVSANKTVSQAEGVRDNAVDQIILVFILLRKTPPEATAADLSRLLTDFANAKADLDKARSTGDAISAQTPYPLLDC